MCTMENMKKNEEDAEDADGDVSGGLEVSHVLVAVEQVKLGAVVVAFDVMMKNSPVPLGLLHPHQVMR